MRARKIFTLLMSLIFVFAFNGCGQNISNGETKSNTKLNESVATLKDKGKVLVVYFSVPETLKPDNMSKEEDNSTVVIDGKVLGNTQYVAQVIQEKTGADIFRIEAETPYPLNHDDLEKVATKEKQDKAFPKIAASIDNLGDYKVIFVGYPNWYGDMPRILYSFFESYDFSGKTIVPFVTSGSSGFSDTIRTITNLEPNATVHTQGLSVTRDKVQNSKGEILSWLSTLGY